MNAQPTLWDLMIQVTEQSEEIYQLKAEIRRLESIVSGYEAREKEKVRLDVNYRNLSDRIFELSKKG